MKLNDGTGGNGPTKRSPAAAATPPARPFASMTEAATAGSRDRRRSVRHPLGAIGVVTSEARDAGANPATHQVLVVNVSLHGVGFRSPAEFEPGSYHGLEIGAGPLFLSSRLQIVCSRPREDGLFDVGARFVGPMNTGPSTAASLHGCEGSASPLRRNARRSHERPAPDAASAHSLVGLAGRHPLRTPRHP